MCFSASASFGAGALLAVAGISAIKITKSPRMLAFASTPLLFGVQQLSEGALWLSFNNPEFVFLQAPSTYIFILFAQAIWPIWVPFVVWLMEPDKTRKKIIAYIMVIGAVTSAYLFYCLSTFEVTAAAEAKHIRYNLYFPYREVWRVCYFLATVIPLFLSTLRLMKLLGGAMLGSWILSVIFFSRYVISVWCFFAAVLSVLVLLIIVFNKESGRAPSLASHKNVKKPRQRVARHE